MKKLFALLFALIASFSLLTSCDLGKQPEKTPEVEISAELKNAKNFIKNIYQASEGNVTSNLDRAASVPVANVSYEITWTVEVTSGKADAVSVEKVTVEDITKYVVSVTYDNTITEEVKFVLTATIASPSGEKTSLSFNHTIPVFQPNTVAEFLEEKDDSKIYTLEGVITAVNKISGKTAFVLSDATSSVFCYAGLEVSLGDKVQLTGKYGENNAFPQIVDPVLVNTISKNNDVAAASGTAVVTTVTAINTAAKAEGATKESLSADYKGKYLEIEGYVVISSTGYANFAVAADVDSCCNLYANENLNLKQYAGAKVIIKGFARGVSVGNGLTIQVQSCTLAPGETMPEAPKEEFKEPAVTTKTLAEIIAMDDANNAKAAYKVTTTVSKLGQRDTDTSAGQYGNLWVGEGEEKILVYGATATETALAWDKTTGKYVYTQAKDFDANDLTKDIKVGDTVVLLVIRSAYNGTPQLMAIVLAVNPEAEAEATATISFADVANRTTFNENQQVWAQNGITVTNDKASSTNNVADYSNPARFYKSSDLKVAYTSAFTKVVINTAGGKDFPADFTIEGATVTVEGTVCTITFATAVQSFTITTLPNQVRVSTIEIFA